VAADAFERPGYGRVCRAVLGGIAGRRAEEHDARRLSRVADFSRRFSHLTLMGVACEIRAAGAGAKRAAR
jgi:hypothetical protein